MDALNKQTDINGSAQLGASAGGEQDEWRPGPLIMSKHHHQRLKGT